jgi:hypothetical protein
MSSGRKGGGFDPVRLTPEEFQGLGMFFKRLLVDHPAVTVSIIAAGIGGALEGLHIVWLAIKYLGKF